MLWTHNCQHLAINLIFTLVPFVKTYLEDHEMFRCLCSPFDIFQRTTKFSK